MPKRPPLKTPADDFRDELRALIKEAGISRAEAARLMRVSIFTVAAYLRPATNKGALKTPLNAVELLAFKLKRKPPKVDGGEGRSIGSYIG